jgi:hypothetical protein
MLNAATIFEIGITVTNAQDKVNMQTPVRSYSSNKRLVERYL